MFPLRRAGAGREPADTARHCVLGRRRRRTAAQDTDHQGRAPHIARLTLALACGVPVVFGVGAVAAQLSQPTSHPVTPSVSALAGHAATSRWIMTGVLVILAVLYMLVAAGLRHLPGPPRFLLGLGGLMLLVVALFPQPPVGSSTVHMVSAGAAWAAFGAWPLAVACSSRVDRRLRRSSAVAGAVLLVMLAFFALQLLTAGAWYGVTEHAALMAHTVWPIRAAMAEVWRPHNTTESARPPHR